jgi:hypothetical protein
MTFAEAVSLFAGGAGTVPVLLVLHPISNKKNAEGSRCLLSVI